MGMWRGAIVKMIEVKMRGVDSNMTHLLSKGAHCSPFQGQLIAESRD